MLLEYPWLIARYKQFLIGYVLNRSNPCMAGFLGLAGFCHKFIKDFRVIAALLTSLLRKHNFSWTDEATTAFNNLKFSLISAPVLQLLDFSIIFVVECDALAAGVGEVLHQNNHPIAFFSRKLTTLHQRLASYEQELIGLSQAIPHWRHFLWGCKFIVRTDHYSLKFLLQRLTISPQHHWISKLLGYDFKVEFQAGRLNTVTNALSRREEETPSILLLFIPVSPLLDSIRSEVQHSSELQDLSQRVRGGLEGPNWAFVDAVIRYKGKIFLLCTSQLISLILACVHDVTHEGAQKTLFQLTREFYWSGMRGDVHEFMRNCPTCQRCKVENLHPTGLLQPLPIPTLIWNHISLDFIEGFPKVQGKTEILLVVDRLSKYAHFIPISHPYTTASVVVAFLANIVKLHGLPETIVSDRDSTFTSNFWKELFRLSGSTLALSIVYRPQTDGQIEVTNHMIEMYLRCLVKDFPRKWLELLPWAEYCYNTSLHSTLHTSPFRVVYGRDPLRMLSF